MAELEGEVQELMALAEAADQAPESTPLKIPAELARRKDRLMKLALARQEIEARFKERQKDRQAEYEAKVAAREDQRAQGHRVKGRDPQPPPNQPDDKAKYALRKQTVEPVFGIIKSVLGVRQFLLRGHAQVSLEWTLTALAYNFKTNGY